MISLNKNDLNYYSLWASIGSALSGEIIKDNVDPELLICKSTIAGRDDSRILWALLTWLCKYSHLINIIRMYNFLKYADTAVLGALIDIAIENDADKKLLKVSKKCDPKEEPELLFHKARKIPEYYTQEIEQSNKYWKKWGLYSSQLEIHKKGMNNIDFILNNNKLLAIRAWIGPNIRSEIIYFILKNNKSYANYISKKLNFSYPPVYIEINKLIRNGILETEQIGKTLLVSLTKQSKKILNYL